MNRCAVTCVMAAVCSTVVPLLAPSKARAADVESPAATATIESAERLSVGVTLVARASSEGSLAERIRGWFGSDAQLSLGTEPSLSAERVLAPLRAGHVAVWVTLRSATQARLYFAAPGEGATTPRYLVRDVPLDHGLDEVGSERVAQVVHSSVCALIEGVVEGTDRPELERALEAPPRKAAEPSEAALDSRAHEPASPRGVTPKPTFLFGGFYRVALGGDEGVAQGPGVALGLGVVSGTYGLTLVGRGAYVLPRSISLPGLTLTLAGPWARAGLRLGRTFRGFRGELELGAGLDWVHREATAPRGSDLVARGAATERRVFAFASLGASVALGRFRFAPRLELASYATRTRHSVAEGGLSTREIAVSSRLQPALLLDALYD